MAQNKHYMSKGVCHNTTILIEVKLPPSPRRDKKTSLTDKKNYQKT